ncbi:MAG: hypothetical protein AAGC70_20285 [Pseudomonadota bacterium]
MDIPPYWMRVAQDFPMSEIGDEHLRADCPDGITIQAWGWSHVSLAEAEDRAYDRARKIVQTASRQGGGKALYYPTRTIREQTLQRIRWDGEEIAVITRNRYFAQVLNTRSLMFVDIDAPEMETPDLTMFEWLFNRAQRRKENAEKRQAQETAWLDAQRDYIRMFIAHTPGAGFRVYRTFGGLRLIATDRAYDPLDEATHRVLDAFGADPLYQRLVRNQTCFRARLTPKHWRMLHDLGRQLRHTPELHFRATRDMLTNWSDLDAKRLETFDDWVAVYERLHPDHHATCRYIETVGPECASAAHRDLISRHDQLTNAYRDLPLA